MIPPIHIGAMNESELPEMVMIWKTDNLSTGSSNDDQAMLPLMSTGTYSFLVKWGDGNEDTITTWNQAETTHTYSSPGTYTITITGVIKKWKFNNTGDRDKLIELMGFGPLVIANSQAFFGCTNMIAPSVTDAPVINITGLDDTFRACTALNLPDLTGWDVSGVTQFDRMFYQCPVFDGDITNWDTSSALDLGDMFFGSPKFNQDISGWDVSGVTNFKQLFYSNSGTVLFDQDLSSWDITSGTNFTNTLRRCAAMAVSGNMGTTLLGWEPTAATNMTSMCVDTVMSTAELDAIYIAWDALTLQSTVTAHFGNATFTLGGAAETAKLSIISGDSWTITDGGGV